MSSFAIYMIGSILVAAGFGFAAHQLGLNTVWIAIIALVIVGFGIMGGVQKTKKREPSE